MEKVRLGIVGYGNMGMPVTEWLVKEGQCPEIDVTAICDCNEIRIAAAKKDYPDQRINFFADFNALAIQFNDGFFAIKCQHFPKSFQH